MSIDIAGVGFHVDTTDLTRGESSLRSFENAGAKAESTVTRAAGRIGKALAGVGTSATEAGRAGSEFSNLLERVAPASAAASTALAGLINRTTGVADANRAAAASTLSWVEDLQREAAAFNALRAALDPAFAAEMRFKSIQEQVNAAVRAGIVDQKEAASVLAMAAGKYGQATPAANALAAATATVGKASNAAKFQVQNAAFQIGDMAVQVAGGTSAMRAMSMQLPQLLGSFGMWGAIAGGVVAVLGALAPALLGNASATQTAAERLDAANAELEQFDQNAKLAATSTAELTDRFGRWGDQIRLNAAAMAQQNIVNAQTAIAQGELVTGMGALVSAYAAYGQAVDNLPEGGAFGSGAMTEELLRQQEAVGIFRDAVVDAAGAMGLTVDQALHLNNAMEALRAAKGPAEMADRSNEALAAFKLIPPAVIAANPALMQAQASVYLLSQNAAQAAAESGSIGPAMSSATAGAYGLGTALQIAAGYAQSIRSSIATMDFTNIGLAAQNAALTAGSTVMAAQAAGQLAEETAKLAPMLGSADGIVRATGQALLDQRKTQIATNVALQEQNSALVKAAGATAKVGGGAKAAAAAERDAAKAANEWRDAVNQVKTTAVDSIIDQMLDGFKGGAKGILDVFKNLLKDMIGMALKNKVQIAFGLKMTPEQVAAGAATGTIGTGGGILGSAATGLSSIGSAFWGGLSSVGTGLMSGGLSGAFSSIGTALSGATTSLAGFAGAIGALAGPVALAVAAFSFFKTKTKELDSGIKVTVDGMHALVEQFSAVEKTRFWGLSKKTTTSVSAASADIADPISKAVDDIQKSVMDAAQVLGVGASAFAGFNHAMTLSTKGMTQDQALQAMQDALTAVGDSFAEMVPGLAGLAKSGEGAMAAITRLSTAMTTVNSMADTLALSFRAAGLAGAAAASDLADKFGGLDALNSSVSSYYQKFYTEAERTATSIRQTTEALNKLGVAMPTSREQYRAMVEAQDLSTEAGRRLFAALVSLAGVMDSVLPTLNAVTATLNQVSAAAASKVDAMINAVVNAQTAALSAAKAWRGVAANLRDFVAETYGTVSAARSIYAVRALNEGRFATVLGGVLAGNTGASGDLVSIAKELLGNIDSVSHTSYEAAAEQAKVLAGMQAAAAAADAYATGYESTASLLGQQKEVLTQIKDALGSGIALDAATMDSLTGQLIALQSAIATGLGSIPGGADGSVIDFTALSNPMNALTSTMNSLIAAILAQQQYTADQIAAAEAARLAQIEAARVAAERAAAVEQANQQGAALAAALAASITQSQSIAAQFRNADAALSPEMLNASNGQASMVVDQNGNLVTDFTHWGNGRSETTNNLNSTTFQSGGWWDQLLASANNTKATATAIEQLRKQITDLGGVPAFAGGGYHRGGLRLVGERGPELEVTGPARIYSARKTRELLAGKSSDGSAPADSTDTLKAIDGLREEMAAARYDQERMLRRMEEWSATGLLTRTA